jgi:hypothetical protein
MHWDHLVFAKTHKLDRILNWKISSFSIMRCLFNACVIQNIFNTQFPIQSHCATIHHQNSTQTKTTSHECVQQINNNFLLCMII